MSGDFPSTKSADFINELPLPPFADDSAGATDWSHRVTRSDDGYEAIPKDDVTASAGHCQRRWYGIQGCSKADTWEEYAMRYRIPALIGTAVVLPLAFAFATAGEASATTITCSVTTGAEACFNPYGETLTVCDTAADGHHAGVYYYRSTSPNTLRRIDDADLGGGNCRTHQLADIPESGWLEFYSYRAEGSTILNYGPFIHAPANNNY